MAIRCVHEAQMHSENCFITLTYDDEHLPPGRGLVKKDFQDFIKRLRKSRPIGPRQSVCQFLRYYHCGEYGDKFGRPHYHAILFGHDFPDKRLHTKRLGNTVYTSSILSELWGKGFCSIGAVTFKSAAYVARYVLKKLSGPGSDRFYRSIDTDTGEIHDRLPEYVTMSLKPGIGSAWFAAYSGDVFPGDFVIHAGERFKTPRFYDLLYERQESESAIQEIKAIRVRNAKARASDNTPERLAVREKIQAQKLKLLKRDTLK